MQRYEDKLKSDVPGSVLALTFPSFVSWEKVDGNVGWFYLCRLGLSLVWDYVNMSSHAGGKRRL